MLFATLDTVHIGIAEVNALVVDVVGRIVKIVVVVLVVEVIFSYL